MKSTREISTPIAGAHSGFWKPTKAQVAAAAGTVVPDIIGPGLAILFVGINPGLYSGAIGHHFGRPGNRFWPALFAGGITPRLFSPFDEAELLALGVGITNLVDRATVGSGELSPQELKEGARRLESKITRRRPRIAAFLGIEAYRTAFDRRELRVGLQEDTIGNSALWLLPNPSGLNAHFQAPDLAKLFRTLGRAAGISHAGE